MAAIEHESPCHEENTPNEHHGVWVNYSDLSGGHPKWWSSKRIPKKITLIQVQELAQMVYLPT